ncbi:hypothetical protein F0919_03890 [Taibaiella lutea]|uniref:Uncharacterized protein n=1 Tax=Taibaiella lutea TaxID=2608001 RepID=A0A5M6CNN3_9BACT|nr:hypothetical protein [Taibaiella lutea]KAA5536821.1 hypothetical protein F0919_03890 [Taibaiella lutea]
MKIIFLLISMSFSVSFYGQEMTSVVDSNTKSEIIKRLISNKENAMFKYLYQDLSYKSKMIRVFNAAVIVDNKDSVSFNYDFVKNVKIRSANDYLIYNIGNKGRLKILASYSIDSTDINLYPPLSVKESFLTDIEKYYNIDSVIFLALYGVNGICIMTENEIWIVNGNERTDLKTYVKENYSTLGELRNLFLLKK